MKKPQTPTLIETDKFHNISDTPKPFLSKSTPSYQKKITCVCFHENGSKCVDPGCILFSSSASHSSSLSSISQPLSPNLNETHLKSTSSCDSCTTFKSQYHFESIHSDDDENISNEILPDFSPCTSKLSLSTEAEKRKYYLSTHSLVNATTKDSTQHTELFSSSFSKKFCPSTVLTHPFPSQIIKGFIFLFLLPYRLYQCLSCQKAISTHDMKNLNQRHKEEDFFFQQSRVQDIPSLCEKSCSRSVSPRFHYLGSFPINNSPNLTCDLTMNPTLKYFLPFSRWLRMLLTVTVRPSATSVLTCFFSCCSCICLILFLFLDSSPMLDQYLS